MIVKRSIQLLLVLVAVLMGCHTATPPPQARPLAPSAGPTSAPASVDVVAIVDKIERNGYQDTLTDGKVLSWTLVSMTVVRPDAMWGRNVQGYCVGHPLLAGRPLLVGQTVSLTLRGADSSPKALEQLEHLARVE